MPFSFSGGTICGPRRGSFAVQFGDHFQSGEHLRLNGDHLHLIKKSYSFFFVALCFPHCFLETILSSMSETIGQFSDFLLLKCIPYHQEIIKVREWIPHIGSLTKVIRLKLFLDIVPSSSEDITRAMRGQPKRLMARTSFYMFWFRFIPEMFSALSAALFVQSGISFVFLLVLPFIILQFIRF